MQFTETRSFQTACDKGYACLVLPKELTVDDISDLREWFELALRMVARTGRPISDQSPAVASGSTTSTD
jgi:hypothetical protein